MLVTIYIKIPSSKELFQETMPIPASEYDFISIFMQPNRGHTKVSPLNTYLHLFVKGNGSCMKPIHVQYVLISLILKKSPLWTLLLFQFLYSLIQKEITLNSLSLIPLLLCSLFPVYDCEIKYTYLKEHSYPDCCQIVSYFINKQFLIKLIMHLP